ncbi:hypothetical protein [Mucilaginibacter sp. UYCu711]|uniref:hypothetical protein n=1 Tax=Mucilaginibacter sp. UYCu711 TaxID=3156339 RepID=UPI003D1CB27E
MKKITIISAIALSGLFYSNANAQLLQIGLHLGGGRPVIEAALVTPSVAVSYSNADQYYYMPEVDAYYSPYENVYYYNDGGRWVSNAYLPGEYRNYDWRTARRYEVRAHRPYLNADVYREKYKGNARDWNRRDDRFDNRRDDRFDNRNDRREDGPRFVRPNDNRGAEHADNRGRDNGNRRDDRNDRGQGNYNQPAQPNRNQGGYNQPSQQPQQSQPSRSNNNGQQQGGRGRGGYNQQPQPNAQPQQNQPSRQNGGGQQRGSVNQGDHFAYNGGQNGQRRF